jgi:hypothetical protein
MDGFPIKEKGEMWMWESLEAAVVDNQTSIVDSFLKGLIY